MSISNINYVKLSESSSNLKSPDTSMLLERNSTDKASDSSSSYSESQSTETVQSTTTKKILSKHENKINQMLSSHNDTDIKREISELIGSGYCHVDSLTVFGKNYRIINTRTGTQYYITQDMLIKGNVEFNKGLFPWSQNSFTGSGYAVKRGSNRAEHLQFNGTATTPFAERFLKKHQLNNILRNSDDEIVCCNTRMSKTAAIKQIFTSLLPSLEENIPEISEDVIQSAGNVIASGAKVIKKIVKDFNPMHEISQQKEQAKSLHITQTPLFENGLALLFTKGNVLLDNQTTFRRLQLKGEKEGVCGLGKIDLNNCSYVGYVTSEKEKGTSRLKRIKPCTSSQCEYPCILSFNNGDILYGLQKNGKITQGFYFAKDENQVICFSEKNNDSKLDCLCTNIENISVLSAAQKSSILGYRRLTATFDGQREIVAALKNAHRALYDNVVSKRKDNEISIPSLNKSGKKEKHSIKNKKHDNDNDKSNYNYDAKKIDYKINKSLRTITSSRFRGDNS